MSKYSGIYVFMPFEKFDNQGKAAVKVGNTAVSFKERLQQYHTYFVYGIYPLAYLNVYSTKKGVGLPKNLKTILNEVEDYILKTFIKTEMGIVIYNHSRVRISGRSEWVYTGLKEIKSVLTFAMNHFNDKYAKINLAFDLDIRDNLEDLENEIENEYYKQLQEENKYVGEIIFNLNKRFNTKDFNKKRTI